jgi:hypothetical protein
MFHVSSFLGDDSHFNLAELLAVLGAVSCYPLQSFVPLKLHKRISTSIRAREIGFKKHT